MYLKYAKTKSGSMKSPTEEGKKSLDCATIALKVLKTSVKYQKFREKHNINYRNDNSNGELQSFL